MPAGFKDRKIKILCQINGNALFLTIKTLLPALQLPF